MCASTGAPQGAWTHPPPHHPGAQHRGVVHVDTDWMQHHGTAVQRRSSSASSSVLPVDCTGKALHFQKRKVGTAELDLQVASLVPATGNAIDVDADWVHDGTAVQRSFNSASG